MYLSDLIFSRTNDIKSIKRDSFLFNAFENIKYFPSTVNYRLATTFRKRPPPVSDHFVISRFVSQSYAVSKTLPQATTAQIS